MSETKRNNSEYRAAAAGDRAQAFDIEHSQPRQTAELMRVLSLWQGGDSAGGDPYNAVGNRATRNRLA